MVIHPGDERDALIVATALHDMTIVTRNVADPGSSGVPS